MRTMYCLLAMIVVSLSWPQVGRAETYRSPWSNSTVKGLQSWRGEHVTILCESLGRNGEDRDPAIMAEILARLDRGYEYYAEVTHFRVGRITIATLVISGNRAAQAIGNNIEIQPHRFNDLYEGVNRLEPVYSHTLFYELGRCYWREGLENLATSHGNRGYGFARAFALLMSMEAMEHAGVTPDKYKAWPWYADGNEIGYLARLERLEADYAASDPQPVRASLGDFVPWDDGAEFNQAVVPTEDNQARLQSCHLQVSIVRKFLRECEEQGGSRIEFLQRVVVASAKLRKPDNPTDVAINLMLCCSFAARRNLATIFEEQWGWPPGRQVNSQLVQLERNGWRLP